MAIINRCNGWVLRSGVFCVAVVGCQVCLGIQEGRKMKPRYGVLLALALVIGTAVPMTRSAPVLFSGEWPHMGAIRPGSYFAIIFSLPNVDLPPPSHHQLMVKSTKTFLHLVATLPPKNYTNVCIGFANNGNLAEIIQPPSSLKGETGKGAEIGQPTSTIPGDIDDPGSMTVSLMWSFVEDGGTSML